MSTFLFFLFFFKMMYHLNMSTFFFLFQDQDDVSSKHVNISISIFDFFPNSACTSNVSCSNVTSQMSALKCVLHISSTIDIDGSYVKYHANSKLLLKKKKALWGQFFCLIGAGAPRRIVLLMRYLGYVFAPWASTRAGRGRSSPHFFRGVSGLVLLITRAIACGS